MTRIGDVLTSTDDAYPDVRVIGGDPIAGRWVVEEADAFSSGPRLLTDEEAAAYKVHDAPEKVNEQRGWDAVASAASRGRRILGEVPLTPEQALAQGVATPVTALANDGSVFTPGDGSGRKSQPGPWATVQFTERPQRREDPD